MKSYFSNQPSNSKKLGGLNFLGLIFGGIYGNLKMKQKTHKKQKR
jgi:hypothetical protein